MKKILNLKILQPCHCRKIRNFCDIINNLNLRNSVVIFFINIFFIISNTYANSGAINFKVRSPEIKIKSMITQDHVFNGFGCSGKNISPQIVWQKAPYNTKSFAVSVYDPDAPTGSGWWHWLLVNIPKSYTELPRDFGNKDSFKINDEIIQIRNDFGSFKYGGPCPPKNRSHRYIFTVYALSVEKLDINENNSPAYVGFLINQNLIAKSNFEAIYKR